MITKENAKQGGWAVAIIGALTPVFMAWADGQIDTKADAKVATLEAQQTTMSKSLEDLKESQATDKKELKSDIQQIQWMIFQMSQGQPVQPPTMENQ